MSYMRNVLIAALLAINAISVRAAELTPILLSNGEALLVCDAQMRFIYNAPLVNKQVVATYLFGNLITADDRGADIFIWSSSYSDRYPAPYPGGPSSQWGSLGDLKTFNRPAGSTMAGRQGESYRSFQPDGVTINGDVQLVYICWGGGTLELYAEIYVR